MVENPMLFMYQSSRSMNLPLTETTGIRAYRLMHFGTYEPQSRFLFIRCFDSSPHRPKGRKQLVITPS